MNQWGKYALNRIHMTLAAASGVASASMGSQRARPGAHEMLAPLIFIAKCTAYSRVAETKTFALFLINFALIRPPGVLVIIDRLHFP